MLFLILESIAQSLWLSLILLSYIHNKSLCQVLLKAEDVNCINIDWINGSLEYIDAVNNLRVVGAEVAYFIDVLTVRKVDFLKLCLIGFAS